MIASFEKTEDQKALLDSIEILEGAIRAYERNPTDEGLINIKELYEGVEMLKYKIRDYEYKE